MHDWESFQEQAREREWRVTQGWSVGSGKKKTRNGGESFQEQARHREWIVTQGWPVGSAKIGTVAKVFKNWGKREKGALPRGGQSERNSGDGFTLVHYFHPAGPLDSLTDPYVDRVYYTTQILRRTCGENMKLHIPHTLEIERN